MCLLLCNSIYAYSDLCLFLSSKQVLSMQQGSWRQRATKLKQERAASTITMDDKVCQVPSLRHPLFWFLTYLIIHRNSHLFSSWYDNDTSIGLWKIPLRICCLMQLLTNNASLGIESGGMWKYNLVHLCITLYVDIYVKEH